MQDLAMSHPVKIFAGVILATDADWDRTLGLMCSAWGEADGLAGPMPFTLTGYYESEMGSSLTRRLVSFKPLVCATHLPSLKHQAIALESRMQRLAPAWGRTANIDVGYLDIHRVVLASTKEGPYKLYMGDGIWADMTLHYSKGRFDAFPWTFPDVATGQFTPFLLQVRQAYKEALRLQSRDPTRGNDIAK